MMELKIRVKEPKSLQPVFMGGKNKKGTEYEVNNQYFIKDGQPVLPIMGEFHFSRWSPDEWEEALCKMKAGGVSIVATYVFWIHHEEKKGEWNFSGCRDLRRFLEVCQKVDMPVWLRIGPWAHGECRNGGFPDWLVEELGHNGLSATGKQDVIHEARTNDPLYMQYVEAFWARLEKETRGLYFADGGPVLGIQLENEYCHAGGPTDISKGFEHMKTLKKLALELGFKVPFYTATGWGGAVVLEKETIPVLGGYVDAPWAGHNKEMPACENFLFLPFREDGNIGTDLKVEREETFTFSKEDNPYLTAELGGGLQVTALRRTYPFAEDIEAQALCMLGAGANLLGYYMYHGGLNPDGKYSTLQESFATGYFNDLPIKSYDFQACIRESGKINQSYHYLKRIHLLCNQFADILAPAVAYFPEETPKDAEDMITPRICTRYNHATKEGFLFINNHQRLREMEPIDNLKVTIDLGDEQVCLADMQCESDVCAIIPYHLKMEEQLLLYTNLSLLTKIGRRYFFYQHNEEKCEPRFLFEDAPYENIVILSKQEANHAYLFHNALYIMECPVFEQDGQLFYLTQREKENILIYQEEGEPVKQILETPGRKQEIALTWYENGKSGEYEIIVDYSQVDLNRIHEAYLHFDFDGDKAALYENGKLLTDWFSNGEDWYVALKRYQYPEKLTLQIEPYQDGIYYDLPPKKGCQLQKLTVEYEVKMLLT